MATDDKRAAAIARLGPEDRALIELYEHGVLGPEEIADVVGLSPAEVERRHAGALARVEREMRPAAATPTPTPVATRSDGPNRRGLFIGAGVLAVVVVIVAIAVASGGGDGNSGSGGGAPGAGASTTTAGTTETAPPEGPVVTMRRLNGTYGRGTAQLLRDGDSAKLRLAAAHFLRPVGGGYAVWLRGGGPDRRLYTTTDTTIERDFRLPANYSDYRYVEVARAIPELDSDYSGLSLLRAKIEELSSP